MMCKIFVPITGSDESKRAVDKAVETAAFLNAKLIAINVLDKDSLAKLQRYKIFIEEESNIFSQSLKRDAQKYFDYAKHVAESFHVELETILLEGDPYSEIYKFVSKDPTNQKFIMIASTKNAENFLETFGVLEKKILRSGLSVIIAGE